MSLFSNNSGALIYASTWMKGTQRRDMAKAMSLSSAYTTFDFGKLRIL
jgi:hypothetical protein